MTSESTPRLSGFTGVVLTARFLTELMLLGGLALAGTQLGSGVALAIVDAVLLPVAAAALWGLFLAPRARRRLPEPARFLLEFALFGVTGVVLALVGWLITGIVVAVTGIGVAALTRVVAKDG
ncbi:MULTISPECIES: YrdB family protein [unclassified Amycolatopsis]|uniref:YrdB family protein n=1 Tax=unclassified Amycolatopsis TaxID=2618356 RepID=UPI002876467B|nr:MULTISPECIES: YrdB family protein [unclassified Amycolatopsis]MDS0132503.1 YrdB family protein [Amycolatopsis sp. 505]MDS0142673.1 YrdB family protein [Amycolatopsis sp. CM201R]